MQASEGSQTARQKIAEDKELVAQQIREQRQVPNPLNAGKQPTTNVCR